MILYQGQLPVALSTELLHEALMQTWILITIAAAFSQNLRSSLQKHLKGVMGTTGATFVRFGFGVPFALLYFFLLLNWSGSEIPSVTPQFWMWASIAAVSQIIATFLLLHLFSFRNFTVGTAYSRTEPVQAAFFALVLFGERVTTGAIAAILVSVIGVMMISVARAPITIISVFTSVFSRTALIGLASGTIFGLAAVGFRAAALSVEHDWFLMQAATTLVFGITLQTVLMLVWMMLREPQEFAAIRKAWKPSLMVGLFGASASFGWFSAFALQQAALVKVVAQIEMLFTFASSIFFFKETINRLEIIGCVLITAGIVLLVLL